MINTYTPPPSTYY